MHCDETGEFVSALCDGETIPRAAAEHIGSCETCQARLRDYVAMGVELRCVASLEIDNAVEPREWARQQNTIAKWWQKGWGTMRIPRLAFVSLVVMTVGLAATLVVGKVGAHADGTVVLLTTTGPKGPLMDCPLSTVDKNQVGCTCFAEVGGRILGYKVSLLSRDGGHVMLGIRTRTYPIPIAPVSRTYTPFELDNEPAKEVLFEPGETLDVEVPDVGKVTLTGEWLDHMPLFAMMKKMDHLEPGPNEVRFASPLLLKDKRVVGDFVGAVGGVFSSDDRDLAEAIYLPGEGRFLIAQVRMKGAVEAHVALSRLSFEEGGHSWEIVNGVPISRADHLWVLHQSEFKWTAAGQDAATFGNQKLVQTAPDVWEPKTMGN